MICDARGFVVAVTYERKKTVKKCRYLTYVAYEILRRKRMPASTLTRTFYEHVSSNFPFIKSSGASV